MNTSQDLYPIYNGDSENYYRMPNEACVLNTLPIVDYRQEDISSREVYLNICKYYDQFKIKYSEYKGSNWVPDKKEYNLKFGVHYQCYKQDRSTFECLLNFRIHYPEVPIVLISDNGHDFSQMSKYFNCTYIHETENSGNGITNVLVGNNKIDIWLNRIKRTCNILTNVEYILYMEDDLLTRDKITKNPNADLAGPSNPDDFKWSPQILNWLKLTD